MAISQADYAAHDGLGLAALVADKSVSPQELVDCAFAAVAAVNPRINAVIDTWTDDLAAQMAACPPGAPFAGVPFLIKDAVLHMAGRPSEMGSRLAAGLVPPHDTHLMERFRAAGFITFGRTASPEMAYSASTEPAMRGPTRNPWNLDHAAGGSSGGAAAAVAAGIVPIAHANDGGGSTRIPASCCGLVGLKPSRGRVPIGPDADEGLNGLGIELAVSRSVRDTAAVLDAVAGPVPGDPYHIQAPDRPYADVITRDPARLRIGVMPDPFGGPRSTDAVRAVVDQVAATCRDLGHHVSDDRPELGMSWDAFIAANAAIWTSNLATWIDGLAAMTGRPIDDTTLEPPTLACYHYGNALSAVDLQLALGARNAVSRSLGQWFAQFDLLLSPTLPTPPAPIGFFGDFRAGETGLDWTHRTFAYSPFTPVFNVSGLPAISLPLGMEAATSLPIGAHFAAGFGREDTLLAVAAQLERATPWAGRRPGVFAG